MLQSNHKTIAQVTLLLSRYGFELGGLSPRELIDNWLNSYLPHWIRLAIVEALYQGRYKAVSVEQILRLWKRRGRPNHHFTYEFEWLICGNLIVADSSMGEKKDHNCLIKPQKDQIIDHPQSSAKIPINHADQTEIRSGERESYEKEKAENSIGYQLSVKNSSTSHLNGKSARVPLKTLEKNAPKMFDNVPASTLKIKFYQDSSNIESSLASQTLNRQESGAFQVMGKRCIDRFVPHDDSSQLYSKLRAVVHQQLTY
ncbi:MAG TPA: hypothetical protein DCF68_14325 [Cyanothece sp. UBA12306]|nr:hypothetical protein [Cyanothece sp. UBA12306]